MSKRKMCPHLFPVRNCPVDRDRLLKCPTNSNSHCELIPPKPRKKMVKVKVWAYIILGEIENISTSKMLGAKPCTITIEAKHLKAKP